MFTVMLWKNKGELRAVRAEPHPGLDPRWRGHDARQFSEMEFLPEHRGPGKAPSFATADEAWAYVRERYPHLAP